MELLLNDPSTSKKLDAVCRVCGAEGEVRCYGMICCVDCRKFVYDQKKKSYPGWCSNNLKCFIGGERNGFWDISSGCQACRHDRIEFLGLLDLTLMKQRNMPRNLPNEVVSNVTGPTTPVFKKKAPPVQSVPSTSSNSTSLPSEKACRICYELGPRNAKHYGVQSCATCANFFLRSWKQVNKAPLQCQMQGPAEGECDLRPSRTGTPVCRYCRTKKCVELKMKHSDQPLVPGSAIDEMRKIMQEGGEELDDRVDGPAYDPNEPLFADQHVKKEEVEDDGYAVDGGIHALDLMMESTDSIAPVAPPPSVCFSPRPIKPEAEEYINQETGEITLPEKMAEFFISNAVFTTTQSLPTLCPVCSTFPVAQKSIFEADACLPCQLFFNASSKADGTFKAFCATDRNCDLRGNPACCSVCRLLRCLQVGMTHRSGNIISGSPIHRLLYLAKEEGWKLAFNSRPKQELPQFLENNEPAPRLILNICDVGKRHCEAFVDAGHGIRSCFKCQTFFKECLKDQPVRPMLCALSGNCPTPCNKTDCRSCRLRRCLEVGMTAPLTHDNSLYSVFLSEWQLRKDDEDDPATCACGRFIEAGVRSGKCSTCMADTLLQMVQSAVPHKPKETNFQRLTREGLAVKLPDSVAVVSSVDGSRKRKASDDCPIQSTSLIESAGARKMTKSGGKPDQMADCQVCLIPFVFKQKYYGLTVCIACSGFFHRSFTEESNIVCPRKKGDAPCTLKRFVQKDLDSRRNYVCARCRLLKWISLGPRVPFYPVPLTPLAHLVEQEQVAVLVPDEIRRGYFRLEPIEDNLKMAADKIFQLVMPGERPTYESEEEPSDSVDSTEVTKEITGAIKRALGRNKENDNGEKNDRDSPESWRQRDVSSPCCICGTLRQRRVKTLGPPACERCVTFIRTCWGKRFDDATEVSCKKHEGVAGRCPLSWRFKLCLSCHLKRAVAVGCVCPGKPLPSSLADLILKDQQSAEINEIEQDENCDTDTEGASPSPTGVQPATEVVQREATESYGKCIGCRATPTTLHYNVRMCLPCHSFLRNNMKPTSKFQHCRCKTGRVGNCALEQDPETNRGCWYCRLKRLLSAEIRLCRENIAGSAVSDMIVMENIQADYVSGGSYAKKSSIMRVHRELCQVCPRTPAASYFHGVFLCKGCRAFIIHQWCNPHILICSNPQDPSKCKYLVAQKCGLCRLVKCISIGARNNHIPHKSSFLNRLCPGYPMQRTIDENVLTSAMERSHRRVQRSKVIKGSSSTSDTMGPLEAPALEPEIGFKEETSSASLPNTITIPEVVLLKEAPNLAAQLVHKFDTQKTLADRVAEFAKYFGVLLSPIDTSTRKITVEDQGFLKGWRACLFGLEPVFTAYTEWVKNIFWINQMDQLARNRAIRDASAEAAVLIVAQVLRLNGCLPYGKDKILRLADLTPLLCTVQHEVELAVISKVLECVSLLEQLNLNGRDLGLLINIILVKKARFEHSVVDEYCLELEDYLNFHSLDPPATWENLTSLMERIHMAGDLFRHGFITFLRRKSFCSSLLNLPPLTKLLLIVPS